MKLNLALWITLLFSGASPAFAEMIQGDGYSFFLSAPLGWVLDKSMAPEAEADAVLYPQGFTYQNAASVITVNTAFKGDGFKDMKDLLKRDETDGRQQNPKFSVRKGPPLRTHLQKSAPLFIYSGFKDNSCQAVAYLEEKDRVMIFALSATDEGSLHEDLPALQETVESYESISGDKGGS